MISLGLPFGVSMGLKPRKYNKIIESPSEYEFDNVSSISVLGTSSLITNSLLDDLQTARGVLPAQQDGSSFKGLLLPGSPSCFLARNLDPNTVTAGILVVDVSVYDKLSPHISLSDPTRTMFHDDMEYFRHLTSTGGKWHNKPFSILLVNCRKIARRISLKQIERLYPENVDDFVVEVPEPHSIIRADCICGIASFFTNLLLQNTDRKMTTYVTWIKRENYPSSIVDWVKAMVEDITIEDYPMYT